MQSGEQGTGTQNTEYHCCLNLALTDPGGPKPRTVAQRKQAARRVFYHCHFATKPTLLNGTRQPGREGSWQRTDACVCMAESLCWPPETITALSIGYTPVQNEKFNSNLKETTTQQQRGTGFKRRGRGVLSSHRSEVIKSRYDRWFRQ